jgi:O-antigen/teichoic acid export membrane protein
VRGPAKHLTKGVAIYGAGDAILQVVNFGLLWFYVHYDLLTPADYGAWGLLSVIETFAKVSSRWGLDGAFMRFYLERDAGAPRRRMASSIAWFLVGSNGLLLMAGLVAAGWIAGVRHIETSYVLSLRLMLVNIALISLTFFPFYVMRMENAAISYSAFTFARAAGTVVLRIVLVIGFRTGLSGVYLADLTMTLILLPLLWRWCRPVIGWTFSTDELRKALRFGLPRLPHGFAQQWIENGPKIFLKPVVGLQGLGVYQNGSALGTAVRFFTSAFETAWAPFYYATSRQPDAKDVFRKMATYGAAILALLVAGTAAVARDLIGVVLTPEYLDAIPVTPILATATALQGVYLLTSIGLNLTSRTEFYPVATLTAAGVGFVLGLWLIPHYHLIGAAVTVLLSYLTQVVVAVAFAQRFYPIRYEGWRLARVVAAAAVAAWVALMLPAMPAWIGVLARGSATVLVYSGLLYASGFFRPTERAFAREMIGRLRRRTAGPRTSPSDDL